jgi:rhodanese-related sulfurtransferase
VRPVGEESLKVILQRHISTRAETLFESGKRTIYARDLKKRMDQGEKLLLLDIRLSENYCAGHITGSINIEYTSVMAPDSLALLPKDGTLIVIICYTGHTASQLDSVLNLMGYNAWTLRFGMMSWTGLTKTAFWSSQNFQEITGGEYPVTVKENPKEISSSGRERTLEKRRSKERIPQKTM